MVSLFVAPPLLLSESSRAEDVVGGQLLGIDGNSIVLIIGIIIVLALVVGGLFFVKIHKK